MSMEIASSCQNCACKKQLCAIELHIDTVWDWSIDFILMKFVVTMFVNKNYHNNSGVNMAHISTYKDAQGACFIITPALAPATWHTVHFKE